MIGIGGGVLLFPFLTYFNFTIHQVVAISLFINAIPNTLPSLYLYYKKGHLQLYTAIIVSIGTMLGSLLGSYLGTNEYIEKKILYRLYTFILFIIFCYMFYFYC